MNAGICEFRIFGQTKNLFFFPFRHILGTARDFFPSGLQQEGLFRVSVPVDQLLASKASIDIGTCAFSPPHMLAECEEETRKAAYKVPLLVPKTFSLPLLITVLSSKRLSKAIRYLNLSSFHFILRRREMKELELALGRFLFSSSGHFSKKIIF